MRGSTLLLAVIDDKVAFLRSEESATADVNRCGRYGPGGSLQTQRTRPVGDGSPPSVGEFAGEAR